MDDMYSFAAGTTNFVNVLFAGAVLSVFPLIRYNGNLYFDINFGSIKSVALNNFCVKGTMFCNLVAMLRSLFLSASFINVFMMSGFVGYGANNIAEPIGG